MWEIPPEEWPPMKGFKMTSNRRTTLTTSRAVAAACLMLIAGTPVVLTGCDASSSDARKDAIDITLAQVRTFEITTLASGELSARDRVELRSEVQRQTTIVEIVPEGTRVEAGDVLVRLNSDDIQREVEEEELQVAEARLQLEAAETAYDIQVSDNAANLRKSQLKVELARLALMQWENGDKVKQLQQLNTAIEKATRDLDRLRENKAKSDELYERNFISYDEWKRDEIELLEAEARFATANLDLKVYTNYQMKRDHEQRLSDLEEAEQELVRVIKSNEINLKNRDSTRQNRAVQLSRREERLANFRRQYEACTIVAPRSGLVVYGSTAQSDNWRNQSEGPIAVGRAIRNNDLIIALPDTGEMIANVKVHEALAGRVRAGQPAMITIEAVAGLVLTGEVESIGLLAETGGWRDPNRREYTVRVAVDAGNHGNQLRPSMRCQAEIILGTVENALSVPVQSVFSEGPVRYVLVPQGARFARRPVQIGRMSDFFAQIVNGLGEGDRVLLREPLPGEVIEEPWNPELLAAAGYALDEEGKPVVLRPERPAAPRGQRPPQSNGETPGRPVSAAGASVEAKNESAEAPSSETAQKENVSAETASPDAGSTKVAEVAEGDAVTEKKPVADRSEPSPETAGG